MKTDKINLMMEIMFLISGIFSAYCVFGLHILPELIVVVILGIPIGIFTLGRRLISYLPYIHI